MLGLHLVFSGNTTWAIENEYWARQIVLVTLNTLFSVVAGSPWWFHCFTAGFGTFCMNTWTPFQPPSWGGVGGWIGDSCNLSSLSHHQHAWARNPPSLCGEYKTLSQCYLYSSMSCVSTSHSCNFRSFLYNGWTMMWYGKEVARSHQLLLWCYPLRAFEFWVPLLALH